MPLVKDGEIVADRYVRILDDAPIPANGAVLVPAERFLAEAAELTARSAETGVLWPNNRDIDELAPYLDKLALVALVFPKFQDGRAYSQARILRERLGFRGELRATGSGAARPVRVHAARRLRLLRGEEGSRRQGLWHACRSATACSISRPATAASPRSASACRVSRRERELKSAAR